MFQTKKGENDYVALNFCKKREISQMVERAIGDTEVWVPFSVVAWDPM